LVKGQTIIIMSTIGGVFSETQLQNVRVRADQIMADERIKLQYIARVDAAKALFERQVMKLNYIIGKKEKDYVAEIEWMNACDLVERECDPCNNGGPELSTNTEIKELDYCKEVVWSVNQHDFRNNDFGATEAMAKGLLRAKKILSEGFNRYMIALLNTFSGVNQGPTSGLGTIVGNNTFLAPTSWGPNGLSYLLRVIDINQFNNPWLLSGANFRQAYLNAKNGIEPDENGSAWSTMPIVFDELNVDAVNSPSLITYLIAMGAYAIGNKADSLPGEVIQLDGNTIKTLEMDETLPLEYDFFVEKSCYKDVIKFDARLKLKGGFYQNPLGCETGNTGILNFVCN